MTQFNISGLLSTNPQTPYSGRNNATSFLVVYNLRVY